MMEIMPYILIAIINGNSMVQEFSSLEECRRAAEWINTVGHNANCFTHNELVNPLTGK